MGMEIGLEVVIGIGASVLLTQALAIWQARALRRTVAALEARLTRQADALALLTETSESGFALVARELERAAATPAKSTRRVATRRIATAARKGRTVAEIAAAEGLSESEVHLRLHMAAQAQAQAEA
jgi:hypothetical protein